MIGQAGASVEALVLPLLVAVLGGGALGVGITAWANRRKTKAETTDLITSSAERIIDRLEKIIVRLEAEKSALASQLAKAVADHESDRAKWAAQVAGRDREIADLRAEVLSLTQLRRRDDL